VAAPADVGRPVHTGPWTLEEVLALPEDYGQRVELVDGNLVMSPLGAIPHQRLVRCIVVALNAVLPDGFELLPGANVVLDDKRLLIPDLVVTMTVGATGLYLTAAGPGCR
jgi:Uma2 family endonuclease